MCFYEPLFPIRNERCYKLTVEQPAALVQSSQVTQDETRHDIIGYQLTLIDAGLHQQAEF